MVSDLNDRIFVAESVISKAAEILRQHEDKIDLVEFKRDKNDPVTEADRASERHIVAKILHSFPNDSVLAEESGFRPGTSGYVWIIDPLDGTKNFVEKQGGYSVNIAIAKGSELLAGFTHDVRSGTLFRGTHKGFSIVGESPDAVGNILLVQNNEEPNRSLIYEIQKELSDSVIVSPTSLCLSHVAAGKAKAVVKLSFSSWDVAPGVVQTQHCVQTDTSGGPFVMDTFHKRNFAGVVVSVDEITHRRILDVLERVMGGKKENIYK